MRLHTQLLIQLREVKNTMRQQDSVSVKEFHNFWLRSVKVYLPPSVPENKVYIFSPRRKLSVLISLSDTTVQAEASMHTSCLPDYS